MEKTGIQEQGIVDKQFLETRCSESCSWDKWFKGGCNCPAQSRLVTELKRDRVHEMFLDLVIGMGAFNCYNESFTNMNNHNIKRPGKND